MPYFSKADTARLQAEQAAFYDAGYSIDRCYAEADRHLTGSDAWHYWMDEAKRLEVAARRAW